ncbi:MAG: hypothetical protein FWC60_00715 [Firmicutes bacterium]|nr:hypothetical protein [Bacillota bacterium]
MYYIAGMTEGGFEKACDFGFDMIERILLDDVLSRLPGRAHGRMVESKRFSYFGAKPDLPLEQLLGMTARRLLAECNINISREDCLATVISREDLLTVLKRGLIKVLNTSCWRCELGLVQHNLFSDIVVISPRFLYEMLSRQKYGVWNHHEDRAQALRVLDKFINFLDANDDLRQIIIYNELMCPHWEASGEIHFNNRGEVVHFNFFGPGNGQLYKYHPQVEAWERR